MLGTGNALATRCYNTCFYLRTPQGGLLVDGGGGNGIFRQLRRAEIPLEAVCHIFITHCHLDHLLGVVWLVRRIAAMRYYGRHPGLTIHCHDEAHQALLTISRLTMPEKIMQALGGDIVIDELADGGHFSIGEMQFTCFDIGSTKAKQLGFTVELPEGGRFTCLGDEPYNERNEAMVRGSRWLLCEAFCLNKEQHQFRPYEKHHSTVLDAARAAQQLGVEHLVLYHTEDTHLSTRRITYGAEAAQVFQGHVHVPDDIETIHLTEDN